MTKDELNAALNEMFPKGWLLATIEPAGVTRQAFACHYSGGATQAIGLAVQAQKDLLELAFE